MTFGISGEALSFSRNLINWPLIGVRAEKSTSNDPYVRFLAIKVSATTITVTVEVQSWARDSSQSRVFRVTIEDVSSPRGLAIVRVLGHRQQFGVGDGGSSGEDDGSEFCRSERETFGLDGCSCLRWWTGGSELVVMVRMVTMVVWSLQLVVVVLSNFFLRSPSCRGLFLFKCVLFCICLILF